MLIILIVVLYIKRINRQFFFLILLMSQNEILLLFRILTYFGFRCATFFYTVVQPRFCIHLDKRISILNSLFVFYALSKLTVPSDYRYFIW